VADLRITGLPEEMSTLSRLPWAVPLESWPEDATLTDMRGISRHVVRLVRPEAAKESMIYAIKETVPEFANREYSLLRELNNRSAPCVEPVAVIMNRTDTKGEELPAALVTHYLPFSLPYRVILSEQITPHEITNMANALALLLVRLHLLGFWWGDCSLSNTLFRRDADQFAAYLVDAETGEFQSKLSDGQREHDLEIALFNVAAELDDLQIAGVLQKDLDPIRASEGVIKRYRRLWKALKEPQMLDPNDRHAVERAMRALQDLGFAVEEVEVSISGDKQELKFQPKLVAAGYHQQRLLELLGIQAEELQAKRLLASFDRFRGREAAPKPPVHDSARRWLRDTYHHVMNQVPLELRDRVEQTQMFHEILEHRWYLGEKAGHDLGLDYATKDYIENILPFRSYVGVSTPGIHEPHAVQN
jgi:Domain of unknown function (DUF4032)/Lipopolysaccharide kinase (Kdo/WaaP) family